jgi:hypothetical protein
MIHRQKHKLPLVRNSAWRRAVQRLDEVLESKSVFSNREKIELFGKRLFGDLWRGCKDEESK